MSHRFKIPKKFFLVLYVIFWCTVFIASGTGLTVYLVGTLGDPLAGKETKAANAKVLDSVLALTNKKVVRYLGKWEFLEPKLPGHFHHIGRWYQSDKSNFCIDCHGPIPHSRNVKERAFLNMHGLFISCQVCHVQTGEQTTPHRFGWVDLKTGRLAPNPKMTEGVSGEYGEKIAPLTGPPDNPKVLRLTEEKEFAEEFRQQMNSLSDRQKVIGNKFIHRKCVEEPVQCSVCHDAKSKFFPFTSLGYSEERAAFLVSTEVVDLIKQYETFHMPTLLKPEQPQGDSSKGEAP
jgi:hypothetical protein